MKPYPIQLEISGPIALWARPDTMPNPVSYVAPTFSAAKGIFEAILRWKSVNVRPTRCEICAPVQFHRYALNYPDSEPEFRDGAASWATERHVIPAFVEMVFNQPANSSVN
jgi:CRISPR-associated Cas5-like protein